MNYANSMSLASLLAVLECLEYFNIVEELTLVRHLS